ncbi:Major facilitator superfamily domain, general substrate transporter [Ascosphaera apis ARSEF 7405]|uniref:Major facilitator superfamily domain, general substrate transporter n=1 Tax=Ascosphaera apis ARSEF 7405 TaxID=392613 RepID=A0A167WTG7_9EURO|nr:Major facilitator superfamily domain, general substrate transporter [Ascosphaera apis ARSEF 7405]
MSKDDDEQTVQCTASQQIDDLEKNVAVVGDRSDPGSIESFNIDPEKEKQLLVKLDLFLAPIICLAYLCCFLDRSNIGNVKVAGMPEDIHASSSQFSTAVSILYATYVSLETPWSLSLKRLTPRYVLTGLCMVWSLTTIFTGFVQNPGGLYATRLILGACEAGLFPALTLYLSGIYQRDELAKRISYLFVATALAGAFGGLLAYGILYMDGTAGVAGWRWVYIIEGLFSFVVGLLIWFGLPNDISKAYFLNHEERELTLARKRISEAYNGESKFSWREVMITVKDPKTYLSGCISFCQDILLYGFSTFLPSIIEAMGHEGFAVQYLTIPVYILGGICFLVFAWFSDKTRTRGPFIFFANFFGIAGYIILLTVHNNGIKYFATFLCAIAVYTGPGMNVTWLTVNFAPHYRRATAIGMQQTIGNTAGIVAGTDRSDDCIFEVPGQSEGED